MTNLRKLACCFSEPILGRIVSRRQVDNKIPHIERRYKNRNDSKQKSGAGNLSQWGLEGRVAAVIGDRPTVHVETVSSLWKDNTKGMTSGCFVQRGGLYTACLFYVFTAIGPEAGTIAEGGGGDEAVPSTSKSTPVKAMSCKRTGADKMLDFMKTFVSVRHESRSCTVSQLSYWWKQKC